MLPPPPATGIPGRSSRTRRVSSWWPERTNGVQLQSGFRPRNRLHQRLSVHALGRFRVVGTFEANEVQQTPIGTQAGPC